MVDHQSPIHTGRSVLRYPGGKTRATKLILPLLQSQQAHTLISPFFGGGSIELAWAKANPKGTVQASDLYRPLVTFWQQALTQPEPLAQAVERFLPLSKTKFYDLQK